MGLGLFVQAVKSQIIYRNAVSLDCCCYAADCPAWPEIKVSFVQGKTSNVIVRDSVSGLHLDPKPEIKAATKMAPSTKAAPPVDTKTIPTKTKTVAPTKPPAAKPDR